ncbi:MAG: C39 family peptidase [Lachnospiraceae bacterium]|nr:C39 family peptidase [Lachnospiraceae bacterium]
MSELQFIPMESTKAVRTGAQRPSGKRRRRKRMQRVWLLIALLLVVAAVVRAVPDLSRNVFQRSQLQSEEYPEILRELYDTNEETYDFVKDYPNREKYMNEPVDLSQDYERGSVPLLMQWDRRWGYNAYGEGMIGLEGCGPTCLTMAYLYFTGDTSMNPRTMAEYAWESGYYTSEGTSWSLWTEGVSGLGLQGETVSLDQGSMRAVLDTGGLIVCSMAPGDFTAKGHFILVRGYDENGFYVNDPNRRSNSEKQWSYDTLSSQIKNLWALYPLD